MNPWIKIDENDRTTWPPASPACAGPANTIYFLTSWEGYVNKGFRGTPSDNNEFEWYSCDENGYGILMNCFPDYWLPWLPPTTKKD